MTSFMPFPLVKLGFFWYHSIFNHTQDNLSNFFSQSNFRAAHWKFKKQSHLEIPSWSHIKWAINKSILKKISIFDPTITPALKG